MESIFKFVYYPKWEYVQDGYRLVSEGGCCRRCYGCHISGVELIDNVGPGGLPRRPRAHGNEALEYQIPPAQRKCLRSLPHHPAVSTWILLFMWKRLSQRLDSNTWFIRRISPITMHIIHFITERLIIRRCKRLYGDPITVTYGRQRRKK